MVRYFKFKKKDTIIKGAYKRVAIVIMNIKHYLKLINDHFNDEKAYKIVESNCNVKVLKTMAKMLDKYKVHLTKKRKKYLISFSNNTSNFSGLNKIQKFKLIQNTTKE